MSCDWCLTARAFAAWWFRAEALADAELGLEAWHDGGHPTSTKEGR